MDSLKEQYEQFPYPSPEQKTMDKFINPLASLQGCPSFNSHLYWPENHSFRPTRILSAGCGTEQAVKLALTNPKSLIVAIDISESSINYSKKLAEKYNLNNIDFILDDFNNHKERYDFIICTGVIHHTENPLNSLKNIESMLTEDGLAYIAVYGKSNKLELDAFKNALKEIGIDRNNNGILKLKNLLTRLPKHHPAVTSREKYRDLENDPGLIDFFLNAREVNYYVEELLQLIYQSNLKIYNWAEPWQYDLSFYTDAESGNLNSEKIEKNWCLAEKFSYPTNMHTAILKKIDKYSIAYEGWDQDFNIIKWRPGIKISADDNKSVIHLDHFKNIEIQNLNQNNCFSIKNGVPFDEIEIFKNNKNIVDKLVRMGVLYAYK